MNSYYNEKVDNMLLDAESPAEEQTINEVVRILTTTKCDEFDLASLCNLIKNLGTQKVAEKTLVAMLFSDYITMARNSETYKYMETEEERKGLELFYYRKCADTIFDFYSKNDVDVETLINREEYPYQPTINEMCLEDYLERLDLR